DATVTGVQTCALPISEIERLSARPSEQLPREPTVSFVSMISGLLMAAELVKHVGGLGTTLETFFQIDAMFPLQNAFLQAVDQVRSEERRVGKDVMCSG